jgi:dephospho-CoA kinase
LASLIFGNEENLRYVNSVIHPAVWEDFKDWTDRQADKELLAIESAILFESGFNKSADFTVNVSAPLNVRIRRVEERDHLPEKAILSRINNQFPDEERNCLSDFILLNDNVEAVIPQLESLLKDNYL